MTKHLAPFESSAAFFAAVAMAGAGAPPDPRLEFSAASGASEGVPSEGGFLVPAEHAVELWQRVLDTGQILRRCTPQPVTRDKVVIPAVDETSRIDGSRFGGVRVYWANEGATVTDTKPKFAALTLAPNKLLGLGYATDDLVADAPALAAWLGRTFGLEAAFVTEDAIINGTGAGQPLGILKSNALITVTPSSADSPTEITPADFTEMAARLWGPSHATAVWLAGNDVFRAVAGLSFSNGSPLITVGADGTRRILGMPLLVAENTAALGETGDLVLADWSQYLVAERAPQMMGSIHVRFIHSESVFRFRFRVDGQPAWASPVTPRNSSTTQAPYVTLGGR